MNEQAETLFWRNKKDYMRRKIGIVIAYTFNSLNQRFVSHYQISNCELCSELI